MAAIYDIAGTTSHSFTIGTNGLTVFYGKDLPTIGMGRIGDIYVQTELEVTENNYQSFGRLYYKCVKNGTITWEFIKNYSFDGPIITAVETEVNSNDFKIAIQKAINTSVVTSTKANDFEKNHSQYGVVRFATDSEENSDVDKLIAVTPKQIKTRIDTLISTHNLDENSHPFLIGRCDNLQEQIDAIESRRDVADIVSNYATPEATGYTTLKAYDKLDKLSAKDIIKVLKDEHNSDRETYYEWVDYIVKNQSDLPTSATNGERARVTSTNKYYKFNGSSWTEISTSGSEGTLVLWNQVGYVDSYTRAQIDDNLVHKTGDQAETITGTKTFSVSPILPTPAETDNTTKGATTAYVTRAITTEDGKVVHKTGNMNETITGTKTFSSVIKETTAPAANSNDTSVPTTAWVNTYANTRLGSSSNVPTIGDANKTYCLSNDGTKYVWRPVRDLTKIEDMDDTSINNPVENQTLVYNASTQKWENGRQITATISYW